MVKCPCPPPAPKPPVKPLQFKRGSSKAFRVANIVLLDGQPAVELDTYKMKIGDGKTKWNSLPYIGENVSGLPGKSAYEVWRDEGYDGTVNDFLEFITGEAGKSAYEIWLSLGNEGSLTDFIVSLEGDSAYDLWVKEGNKGTITDFLNSLKGKSAYEIWLSLGNEGSEQDFIDSLKGEPGKSAYEVWRDDVVKDPDKSESDFIEYLTTTTWGYF